MTLSDQVRELFWNSIAKPAHRARQQIVSVAVSDISRELGWTDRYPLICSALMAQKFHRSRGLRLERVTDPCPSSSTILTFRLA